MERITERAGVLERVWILAWDIEFEDAYCIAKWRFK